MLSSNNPIEVEQLRTALEHNGVNVRVDGETALSAGSIELTGIGGASIFVETKHLTQAKKTLIDLGFDKPDSQKGKYSFSPFLILLGLFFLVLIILAVMSAIK